MISVMIGGNISAPRDDSHVLQSLEAIDKRVIQRNSLGNFGRGRALVPSGRSPIASHPLPNEQTAVSLI